MNFIYSGSYSGGNNAAYQPYSPPPAQQHQLPPQFQPQMYQPPSPQPMQTPNIHSYAAPQYNSQSSYDGSEDGSRTITIHRPGSNVPWGFRLQGGSDYRTQLSVKKTEQGSPSYGILTPGDAITSINGKNTRDMTHAEATNLIKRSSGSLNLTVMKNESAMPDIRPSGPVKFSPAVAAQMIRRI